MTHTLQISFAVNNPDNGQWDGRVSAISLPDSMLDLTANGAPRLVEFRRTFKLAGKRWPFVRRASWVGNWCWEGYTMEIEVATAFLTWLHGRRLFSCDGGWVEIAEAWGRPGVLVLPDRWWVA